MTKPSSLRRLPSVPLPRACRQRLARTALTPKPRLPIDALEAAPATPDGELARIDALIRRATPASVAERMFVERSWLHATRVLYWRAQHPRPAPPLSEKKGSR